VKKTNQWNECQNENIEQRANGIQTVSIMDQFAVSYGLDFLRIQLDDAVRFALIFIEAECFFLTPNVCSKKGYLIEILKVAPSLRGGVGV